MKIAICLGSVPDTTTKVKFTGDNTAFDTTGVQWVINPWDELALTRALELKEVPNSGIEKITVINVGGKDTEPTIRKALAIGADDAIRVDASAGDSFFVAAQLAEVVKKEGFDIVISGIESSDYNGAAVGGMLSEFLEFPSVSAVSFMEMDGNKVKFNRDIDGGKEVVTSSLPLVAIIQKGITKEPRIPSMRGIMMARKKPLNVVPAIEAESMTEFINFELPQAKGACKYIDPENVKELIDLLHNEAKAI
ncbi:electron transfer flavoprotein subunit beta/FixA family protein [Bacteroidota bacterium]